MGSGRFVQAQPIQAEHESGLGPVIASDQLDYEPMIPLGHFVYAQVHRFRGFDVHEVAVENDVEGLSVETESYLAVIPGPV